MSGRGRARRIVAVAAGAGLLLGACSTDREVTRPEPVAVTEDNVADAVIAAEDLPDGYAEATGEGAPLGTDIIEAHDCDDRLTELTPEIDASRSFTGPGGSTLTHTVAWFPGGGGAAVEQLLRDIAADCAQVVVADAGISVRTGALDFGVLSDDTLAIRFEIEPTTGPILETDIILRRDGDLVSVVRLDGPRPSDKVVLDAATRAAISRLGTLGDEVYAR